MYDTKPIDTLDPENETIESGIPEHIFLQSIHKAQIIELLQKVKRPGIDQLINYLETESDFFEAPASTKYHSNFYGGLTYHSLEVYYLLEDKNLRFGLELPEESRIICGLLHDVCKANFYAEETKSVLKGKKEVERNKKDENGNWFKAKEMVNDWQEEKVYVVKDQFPMGHGEKSVIQILKFINLTDIEIAMIRWHMGFSEAKDAHRNLNNAIDLFPCIMALYTADIEASYFKEERKVV